MGCDLSPGYFLKKNLLGSIEIAMDTLELRNDDQIWSFLIPNACIYDRASFAFPCEILCLAKTLALLCGLFAF